MVAVSTLWAEESPVRSRFMRRRSNAKNVKIFHSIFLLSGFVPKTSKGINLLLAVVPFPAVFFII